MKNLGLNHEQNFREWKKCERKKPVASYMLKNSLEIKTVLNFVKFCIKKETIDGQNVGNKAQFSKEGRRQILNINREQYVKRISHGFQRPFSCTLLLLLVVSDTLLVIYNEGPFATVALL